MCRPASEGGQRCASHTRRAFRAASKALEEAVASSGYLAVIDEADRAWERAAIAYASTTEGAEEIARLAGQARRARKPEREARLQSILTRGANLRAVNTTIRQAARAPRPTSAPAAAPTGPAVASPPTAVAPPAAEVVTGQPVTLPYLHNRERAPHAGDTYGQDVEPAGRYLSVADPGGHYPPDRYDTGQVTFARPLVMEFGGGYRDPDNWKRVLSATYGGKTGVALSRALRADGFDAIITRDKYGFSEVVDLTVVR